jgi:hypothetical protein
MIVVRIYGGLGNQLFQYYFGQYLKASYQTDVFYDLSYFKIDNYRKPSILNFSFDLDLYEIQEGNKNVVPFKSFRANKIFNLLTLNKQYHTKFDKELKMDKTKTHYFDGYWQSLSFISSFEGNLDFEPKTKTKHLIELAKQINSYPESIAIHIRRTDYLTPKNRKIFKEVGLNYYRKAIEFMQSELGEQIKFFVFSDDLEWSKKHMSFLNNPTWVEKGEDYEDLYLMAMCKHQITANSTFSWWAAMKNPYQKKKVITPSEWYVNDKINNLIPKFWIQIEA